MKQNKNWTNWNILLIFITKTVTRCDILYVSFLGPRSITTLSILSQLNCLLFFLKNKPLWVPHDWPITAPAWWKWLLKFFWRQWKKFDICNICFVRPRKSCLKSRLKYVIFENFWENISLEWKIGLHILHKKPENLQSLKKTKFGLDEKIWFEIYKKCYFDVQNRLRG